MTRSRDELRTAIRAAAAAAGRGRLTDDQAWVTGRPSAGPPMGEGNQFLLCLKPELTGPMEEAAVDAVLAVVLERLDAWGVRLGTVRVLTGRDVRAGALVPLLYHELARISRRGLAGCPPETRQRVLAETGGGPVDVLGGHQLLGLYPGLLADDLRRHNDQVGSMKVGPGAYAARLGVTGRRHLVLNAFHPAQEGWLSRDGAVLVAMECFTDHPWRSLRTRIVGFHDPVRATGGSIRRALADAASRCGIREFGVARNGVHVSPGPVEATFQLAAVLDTGEPTGERLARSVLARRLAALGLPHGLLAPLSRNPVLPAVSRRRTLFGATEDLDVDRAAHLLGRLGG